MSDIILRPAYWASVSGGKDSLYMLKLILSMPEEYPLDGVVHFELEIDFPFIADVISYMRSECEKFGIQFVTIKPRKSYWDLLREKEYPDKKRRWCNGDYKLDAKKQLQEFLEGRGERLVSYIGFCADEDKRFREKLGDRENVESIYPLAEQGIEESTILEWAKTVPLFNDYYVYNKRCGCMYCPMTSMRGSAYLREYYPKEYYAVMGMAKERELHVEENTGKKFSCWSGNPDYNTDFRLQKVRQVHIYRLRDEIELHEKGEIKWIL